MAGVVTVGKDHRWFVWDARGKQVSPAQLTFLVQDKGNGYAVVIRPCAGGIVVKAFKQGTPEVVFSQAFYEGKIVMFGQLVLVGKRLDKGEEPGIAWAVWSRAKEVKKPVNWWCGVVTTESPVNLTEILRDRFGKQLEKNSPAWICKLFRFVKKSFSPVFGGV